MGLFLGWIPFGLALFVLAQTLGIRSRAMVMIPAAAYTLTWAVFSILVAFSHCPRCGKLFHGFYGCSVPLCRRCRYCELPITGEHGR